MPTPPLLESGYRHLKRIGAKDLKGEEVASTLQAMATEGWSQLWTKCLLIEQTSLVPGKSYVAFSLGEKVSRPVNSVLFVRDPAALQLAEQFIRSPLTLNATEATRAVYTIARSVIAANDVFEVGRKASATFYEILIGHMVAAAIGMNPTKRVRMPENPNVALPTDYVFDLGSGQPKIHLPVKTSTRERIVQAWVHQLVLERIFGANVFRGLLVVIGETKRNTKTNAVIEICTPKQLQLIQARIAKMDRVYYLDPPAPYLALRTAVPARIEVRPFGEFFSEVKTLTAF